MDQMDYGMEGEGSPEMDDYGQEGGAMVEGQMMGDEYDQVSGLFWIMRKNCIHIRWIELFLFSLILYWLVFY